jgi:hypothetical protein
MEMIVQYEILEFPMNSFIDEESRYYESVCTVSHPDFSLQEKNN